MIRIWCIGCCLIAGGIVTSVQAQSRSTVIGDPFVETQNNNTKKSVKSQQISLMVQDSTVQWAVQTISRMANLKPLFNANSPELKKRIRMRLDNLSVEAALREVLKGTGLSARLTSDGESVMIRSQDPSSDTKTIVVGQIVGRVTDSATNRGLGGVTVSVRGSNIARTTNPNGEFTLNGVAAGEQTIEFKLVGYRALSRTVRVIDGETVTINTVLRTAPTILSEVVTTALGQQQRKDIGYSVASLNVDSIRRVAPIKSMTDLFENRIPGVTVQRTSGSPGDPARIRLRGASSINENNDPVIYVDGSRRYGGQSDARNIITAASGNTSSLKKSYATTSPLDQIDPASIERIDVLKGPAAAAMYGPDAASGVIVITTKRGQTGPPQWTLGLQAGMSEFPGSWPVKTYQWVTPTLGGTPALCIGYCGENRIDSVRKFQALNDPYLTPLGRGNSFNPSATLAGGSGQMTYTVTASSLRDRGILKLPQIEQDRYVRYQNRPVPGWMVRPDLLERRNVSANMQTSLNAAGTTRLSLETSLAQEVQHRTSMTSSGGTGTAIGLLQGMWVDRSQLLRESLIGNPYQRVTSPKQTVNNTVSVTAQPLTWLSAQMIANMSSSTRNSSQILEAGVMPENPLLASNDDESGGSFSAQSAATSNSSVNMRFWTPMPIRRVRMNAGFNYDRERTEDQSGSFWGVGQGVDDPSQGRDSSRTTFQRRTSESVFFGYYLVPQLVLSERFNISPGFRLDQNGLSGENAKFLTNPKLDGSWLLSDESFFPAKGIISEFRIRGAFGISGNQPTTGDLNRLYKTLTINPLTSSEPLYGDMWDLTNLGNTKLRPEQRRESEMGVDLSVWNNRIRIEYTYTRQFTKDAIVSQPIASSVFGRTSLQTNVGDLQGQTNEFTLNATPIERKNIGVQFTLNFDRQTSLVKRLARGTGVSLPPILDNPDGQVNYVPGYPLDGIWMRPIRGYNDLDGNGWIASNELVIGQRPMFLGSTTPEYTMSLYPTVTLFKTITLSAGIAHVSGQMQSLPIVTDLGMGLNSGPPYVADLVFGPEGFNRQAAWAGALLATPYRTPVGFVQKVDQTRLQYVSVGTTVSPRFAQVVKARSMTVSLQGKNLALWTNYIGVDPNVNGSLSNAGLLDNGQLPQPREWSLNFSLRY